MQFVGIRRHQLDAASELKLEVIHSQPRIPNHLPNEQVFRRRRFVEFAGSRGLCHHRFGVRKSRCWLVLSPIFLCVWNEQQRFQSKDYIDSFQTEMSRFDRIVMIHFLRKVSSELKLSEATTHCAVRIMDFVLQKRKCGASRRTFLAAASIFIARY